LAFLFLQSNPSQSAARARPANTKLSGKCFSVVFCYAFEHFVVTAVAPAPPTTHAKSPWPVCQSSYDFHSRFQKPEKLKKHTEKIPIAVGL